MPERRGRRLAGAPKSGNEIFRSGLSNFWWMVHNHQKKFIDSFFTAPEPFCGKGKNI
jgi:hypothetical protein